MDKDTATEIGRELLVRGGAPSDRIARVAETLQRLIPSPEVWAFTTNNQLAVLSGGALWIATARDDDNEETTAVEVQRLGLNPETVRVSLTETHHAKWDHPHEIAYAWRFSFDQGPELRFEARERYEQGAESDDRAVVFGRRLAEAVGWPKPGGGKPLVAFT